MNECYVGYWFSSAREGRVRIFVGELFGGDVVEFFGLFE